MYIVCMHKLATDNQPEITNIYMNKNDLLSPRNEKLNTHGVTFSPGSHYARPRLRASTDRLYSCSCVSNGANYGLNSLKLVYLVAH